eukprot:scaffold5356_cov118-Isochrysis_galbana.AAC.2
MASGTLSSPSRLVCVRNSPRVLPTLAAGRAPVALALSPESSSAPPAGTCSGGDSASNFTSSRRRVTRRRHADPSREKLKLAFFLNLSHKDKEPHSEEVMIRGCERGY